MSPSCLRTPADAFPTVVFGYFGAWEQFRPPGVGSRVTNEQHSGVYGESHCHLYSYQQDRHAATSPPTTAALQMLYITTGRLVAQLHHLFIADRFDKCRLC